MLTPLAVSSILTCRSIYLETLDGGRARPAAQAEAKLVPPDEIEWQRAIGFRDELRSYAVTAGRRDGRSFMYLRTTELRTGATQIHKSYDMNFGPTFYFDVEFPISYELDGQRYEALELECKMAER